MATFADYARVRAVEQRYGLKPHSREATYYGASEYGEVAESRDEERQDSRWIHVPFGRL
mgnify:CR=1 FL=1